MRISDWSSDVCSSDLATRTSRVERCLEKTRWRSNLELAWRRSPSRKQPLRRAEILPSRPRTFRRISSWPSPSAPAGSSRERSEEHTSELQSLMRISYAVFCLKKTKQKTRTYINNEVET